MTWNLFIYFAAAAALLWVCGSVLALSRRDTSRATAVSLGGTAVLFAFIVSMWVSMRRPPLRTMGETRLWYSFFLSAVGAVVYRRSGYKWILAFGTGMAIMFLCINVFKPEIHTSEIMPALQSPWFVPHVTVYMFAYALLGVAMIYALVYAFNPREDMDLSRCDSLVRAGLAFLTMGMAMGALWAKTAWGDWWTWDPKETWAMATWSAYMLYLHARPCLKSRSSAAMLLVLCFLMLCMCWFGVNWLPSAAGSVHSY